jgi:hypothetical protein
MDFAAARISHRPAADLATFFREYQTEYGQNTDAFLETSSGYFPTGHSIDFAELQDRLLLSPISRAMPRELYRDVTDLPPLSRYAAEIAVQLRVTFRENWLPEFLLNTVGPEWREFLMSPAAAPVLRAALWQLNRLQCAAAASSANGALGDDTDSVLDIDTAVGLALLAWRGDADELCTRILDSIIWSCREGTWQIFDVPEQQWGDLADMLMSSNPAMAIRRCAFAELMTEKFHLPTDEVVALTGNWPNVEFIINALRIGADFGSANPNYISDVIFGAEYESSQNRKWFLLVVRMARERDEQDILLDLLAHSDVPWWQKLFGVSTGEAIRSLDFEKISIDLDLTYREAMDLRWALEVAREPARRRPRPKSR